MCSALPPWRVAPRPCSCTCACARRTRGLRAAVRRAHVALGRRPGPHRSRRCRAVDRRGAGFSGEAAGAVVPVCRARPGRARDRTRLRAVAARRTAFSIGARWRQVPRRTAAAGLLVLAAFVALYALLGMLPHADVPTMVSVVRSRFPTHEYVDWAIYFAVSGSRGVRTSICQNLGDPTYPLHSGNGSGRDRDLHRAAAERGKTVAARRAAGRRAAVPLPERRRQRPVALDRARGPERLASLRSRRGRAGGRRRRPSAGPGRGPPCESARRCSSSRSIHPKTWPIEDPIFSPAPVIDRAVQEVGGPRTPRFRAALARCDADWRSVLGDYSAATPNR